MSLFSKLFGNGRSVSLTGMTDWHSHILPGVDDGVKSMEQALEILERYEHYGISRVWFTPHIMEDYPNTTSGLRARFDELREAYKGAVELNLASENMLDNIFAERLEANDLLPIGDDGSMLLVETSYYNAPMHFYETLEAVKSKGYYPLLAHPERYNYIDSMDTYRKLKDMGVRFQVNLMSLAGHYGTRVRDKARRIVAEGMADHFGSDLHHGAHLTVIRDMTISRKLADTVNSSLLQH